MMFGAVLQVRQHDIERAAISREVCWQLSDSVLAGPLGAVLLIIIRRPQFEWRRDALCKPICGCPGIGMDEFLPFWRSFTFDCQTHVFDMLGGIQQAVRHDCMLKFVCWMHPVAACRLLVCLCFCLGLAFLLTRETFS